MVVIAMAQLDKPILQRRCRGRLANYNVLRFLPLAQSILKRGEMGASAEVSNRSASGGRRKLSNWLAPRASVVDNTAMDGTTGRTEQSGKEINHLPPLEISEGGDQSPLNWRTFFDIVDNRDIVDAVTNNRGGGRVAKASSKANNTVGYIAPGRNNGGETAFHSYNCEN